jgi:hypothetical protein
MMNVLHRGGCQGCALRAHRAAASSLTAAAMEKEWQGSANGEMPPLALLVEKSSNES